jgi:Matrixin
MRPALYAALLMLGVAACESGGSLSPKVGQLSAGSGATRLGDLAQVVVMDSARAPATGGGTPVATTEGDDFKLQQGGLHWLTNETVEYAISGTEEVAGGNTAIAAAATTWNAFVSPTSFARNDGTGQTNPCTNSPNTVQWAAIDGAGGTVAATSVCYVVQTKEIVGFAMTVDNAEPWSIGGTPTTLDVQNTVTHEFGHVAGLGHVHPWKDGCLTMFPYVADGETQKRTLGLGDKLGMQDLYGSTDVAPGTCGN